MKKINQTLVIINSKKEAVVSHILISEGMVVTCDSTLKLIKKYKKELEEFGKVRFQIVPLKSGQKRKEIMLNQPQAIFLISLMRNNYETVAFKLTLVKQFLKMQMWITERLQASIEYKVMSEILKNTRQLIGKETKSFHYSNEAILVNWAITGEFKGLDRTNLSFNDIELLNQLLLKNAVLIGAGMSREKRKESLCLLRLLNQETAG